MNDAAGDTCMRCLRCGYSLAHLERHRCPECGEKFDPADASTFDSHYRRAKAGARCIRIANGCALYAAVACIALLTELAGRVGGYGAVETVGMIVLAILFYPAPLALLCNIGMLISAPFFARDARSAFWREWVRAIIAAILAWGLLVLLLPILVLSAWR